MIIPSMYFKIFPRTYIFCFHRVITKHIAQTQMVHRALFVTPKTFEANIRWMLQHGDIVTTDDLYNASHRTRFIITFDDGWKDCFLYAIPILKKYNCCAEFFLSTWNIDNRVLFWTENVGILIGEAIQKSGAEFVASRLSFLINEVIINYDLRDKIDFNISSRNIAYLMDRYVESVKYIPQREREEALSKFCEELGVVYHNDGNQFLLNWDEISSMAHDGFRFGSHTHSHALLDRAENEIIDSELVSSKNMIERKLGVSTNMFSYPNGYYQNPYIQMALEKHGYIFAYTLESKPFSNDNKYFLPRFLLFEDICRSMDIFIFNRIILNKIKPNFIKSIYRSIMSKIAQG